MKVVAVGARQSWHISACLINNGPVCCHFFQGCTLTMASKVFLPSLDFSIQSINIVSAYTGLVIGICTLFLPNLCPNFFTYLSIYGKATTHLNVSRLLYLPKRWFFHFYILAVTMTCFVSWTVLNVYFWNGTCPDAFRTLLRFLSSRHLATMYPESVVIACLLMLCQVMRRLWECLYVSVYSDAKMTIVHYMVAMYFYTGVALALVAEAPGFATNEYGKYWVGPVGRHWISRYHVVGVAVFIFGFVVECQSHLILANLRKNENGEVVSHKHCIPTGGWFSFVSCPNYMGEILMYLGVHIVFGLENATWATVFCFVLFNQLVAGSVNHEWYKRTFPNYPKKRRAVIPYVL